MGTEATYLACGLQSLLQRLQLGRGHSGVQVQEKPQHMTMYIFLPGKDQWGSELPSKAEPMWGPHVSSAEQN